MLATLTLVLSLIVPPPAMPTPDSTDFDLGAYQWQNRLILVFASSEAGAAYEEQMRLFDGAKGGFAERDLLLITILSDDTSRAAGRALDADAEARLRERFGVAPDQFRVVLIGKDGTEKRRDEAPTRPASLYETIDAMPMRQREMREQDDGR